MLARDITIFSGQNHCLLIAVHDNYVGTFLITLKSYNFFSNENKVMYSINLLIPSLSFLPLFYN